jgi:drug/metabolite transporter (DMT)-like permease
VLLPLGVVCGIVLVLGSVVGLVFMVVVPSGVMAVVPPMLMVVVVLILVALVGLILVAVVVLVPGADETKLDNVVVLIAPSLLTTSQTSPLQQIQGDS